MIKLYIEPTEYWDANSQQFVELPGGVFAFENSLRAISKWESKWRKSYFDPNIERTNNEILDYYVCMCMSSNFSPAYLNREIVKILSDYISTEHTATTTTYRKDKNKGRRKQRVTSEYIYAQMAVLGIPFDADKWEISRLIKTIECCSIMTNPDTKKKSPKATAKDYAALNRARLAKYKTKG